MTNAELRALGLSVWGHEWQSPLARAMGVNKRTVARWARGDTVIPESVSDEIRRVLGAGDGVRPEWPRDEWIVGAPPGGAREYVIHTARPRFVARAVAVDDFGAPLDSELPADTQSGVVYIAGDSVICEIVWADPPPAGTAMLALMDQAADALDGD